MSLEAPNLLLRNYLANRIKAERDGVSQQTEAMGLLEIVRFPYGLGPRGQTPFFIEDAYVLTGGRVMAERKVSEAGEHQDTREIKWLFGGGGGLHRVRYFESHYAEGAELEFYFVKAEPYLEKGGKFLPDGRQFRGMQTLVDGQVVSQFENFGLLALPISREYMPMFHKRIDSLAQMILVGANNRFEERITFPALIDGSWRDRIIDMGDETLRDPEMGWSKWFEELKMDIKLKEIPIDR